LADALAAARPSIILNNGEVTVDKVTLPVRAAATIASGISYNWSIVSGDNVATLNEVTGLIEFTRLYTQQKVVLEVSVSLANVSPQPAGQNSRQFEFRVMPFEVVDIQERIEDELTAVALFERAPRFLDMDDLSSPKIGTTILDLDDLLNSGLLETDGASSVITYSLKSNPASLQSSNIRNVASNLVYIESGTNELKLARNAFNVNGAVEITVTANVEVRFVSTNILPDVTYTDSFSFTLFNEADPIVKMNTSAITSANLTSATTLVSGVKEAYFVVDKFVVNSSLISGYGDTNGAVVTRANLLLSGVGLSSVVRRPIALNVPLGKQFISAGLPSLGASSGIKVGAEIFFGFYNQEGKLVEVVNPIEIDYGSAITPFNQGDITKVLTAAPTAGDEILTFTFTDGQAEFRTGLSNTTLASYISSGVAASDVNIARIKAAIVAGDYAITSATATGTNNNQLIIYVSGLTDDASQSYKLDGRLFRNTHSAAITDALTTAALDDRTSPINGTNLKFTAAALTGVVKGDNFIRIILDDDAVFAPQSQLTSGTIKLLPDGPSDQFNHASGIFNTNSSPFVRVNDRELILYISDSKQAATSGLIAGEYELELTSGAIYQNVDTTNLTHANFTVTVGRLDVDPKDQVVKVVATGGVNPSTDYLKISAPGGVFNLNVSQSDLIFSGVHSQVFAAADVVRQGDTELRIVGFESLAAALGAEIEVHIRPSAFVKAPTSAIVVEPDNLMQLTATGTDGSIEFVTGGATLANPAAANTFILTSVGGNFKAATGDAKPDLTIEGLPDGLAFTAAFTANTKLTISVTGTATDPVADGTADVPITITVKASAFAADPVLVIVPLEIDVVAIPFP
jgi:hypothetical protein